MTKDIESRVINVTANVLSIDPSKITLDSSLANDLGADSLDSLELIMAFEAEFDSLIPEQDANKILTIRDAVNYIETKLSENKA